MRRPQGAASPTCCSWMLPLLALGEEVTPILFVKARLKAKALLGFAWRPGEGQGAGGGVVVGGTLPVVD